MDSTTQNVPETIRQEAKARALKIIEQNQGCQSYVRPEDLETAALFIPVVSVIKPTPDDFYPPIPKVGIMAKPQLVNLLKEKAGINITRTETQKRGDYVYVAHIWGEKRQPDGTMLTEDASYEFDCNVRAELDHPDDNEKARRRHVLELAKFGEQRAVTGAQHSLIHKLAHVARSFKTPEELMRGMIVSRVDRNVNGMMADPAMRGAIIQHALGATEQVFGPKQLEGHAVELAPESPASASAPSPAANPRKIDPDTSEVQEHEQEEGQSDLFEDEIPWPVESKEELVIRLRDQIRSLLNDPAVSKSKAQGAAWLETHADAKDPAKLAAKQKSIEGAIANYRARAKVGAA